MVSALKGRSLGFKFSAATATLLVALAALLTSLVYFFLSQFLTYAALERGEGIARSAASGAAEAIFPDVKLLDVGLLVGEIATGPVGAEGQMPDKPGALVDWLLHGRPNSSRAMHDGVVEAYVEQPVGQVLAHSDRSQNGQRVPERLFLPWNGQGEGHQLFMGPDGVPYFLLSVPIVVPGAKEPLGIFHVVLDRQVIELEVRRAALVLLVLGVAGVSVSLLLIFSISRWMFLPLRRLTGMAEAIAAGDFSQKLQVRSQDELGDLTQAFNEMGASLRKKRALLAAFQRYLDPSIIEEVLKDPTKLGLHGKQVEGTVFFSDLRGFTSMSESMEPEEVVSTLNEYLSVQARILRKHGGSVNKIVGDATMALFGVPVAGPDDAVHAIQASLEIQDAMEALNVLRKEKGLVTRELGVGIATGDMVVGNMGSINKLDYTVIGWPVLLADRLCARCRGGEILSDTGTNQKQRGLVQAEALPRFEFPGEKGAIQAYVYRVVERPAVVPA